MQDTAMTMVNIVPTKYNSFLEILTFEGYNTIIQIQHTYEIGFLAGTIDDEALKYAKGSYIQINTTVNKFAHLQPMGVGKLVNTQILTSHAKNPGNEKPWSGFNLVSKTYTILNPETRT